MEFVSDLKSFLSSVTRDVSEQRIMYAVCVCCVLVVLRSVRSPVVWELWCSFLEVSGS